MGWPYYVKSVFVGLCALPFGFGLAYALVWLASLSVFPTIVGFAMAWITCGVALEVTTDWRVR